MLFLMGKLEALGLNVQKDVIFVLDMVLQFFIAFQQEDILGGHTWVEDQRLIARNYLSSWFILDASVIFVPGVFDLMLAAPRDSAGGEGESPFRNWTNIGF